MAETFRIGIVGIGSIAETHARAIAEIKGAEVVAGSCRTAEKGERFAKQFRCRWFADFRSLIDETQPDVITVCTPSGAHMEPALYALERGIHVLCEKPIEITLPRLKRMIDAAVSGSAMLGGIFPQRFNPVVRAVYDAAADGRFGKLAVASAYVPWWRDDDYYAPDRWQGTLAMDGGGAMMNQAIHAIDAMQWIAGAAGAGPAVEAIGFTAKRAHDPRLIEVEDTACAAVRFADGTIGHILAATSMWPGGPQRIHFGGRDGTAEIHEQQLVTYAFRDERPGDQPLRERFGSAGIAGGAADPKAIDDSNHVRNIEDFLAAIAEGAALSIDGLEARKAVAIITAIYRSVASVKVEQV